MNTEKLKGKTIADKTYYLDGGGELTTDLSKAVELYVSEGQPLKELPGGRIIHDDGEIFVESKIERTKEGRSLK